MVYPVQRLRNPSPSGMGAEAVDDPLQHLVACHERIQERLQTLERVVPHLRADSGGERREARQALQNAVEFLQTMGSLHTQDEEQSLFPRLRRSLKDDPWELGELMLALETQHREKEGVLAELVACVNSFPQVPEPPTAEQVSRLDGLVAQLGDHYRPHITLENERLIPLSRECLQPGDLEQIQQEMRARRGQ